jgi:hypothetical protein
MIKVIFLFGHAISSPVNEFLSDLVCISVQLIQTLYSTLVNDHLLMCCENVGKCLCSTLEG